LGFPSLDNLPKDQDGYPFQPIAQEVDVFNDNKVAVVQIAGGDGHTVAVTENGRLKKKR